jgi:hypothetical protein
LCIANNSNDGRFSEEVAEKSPGPGV